MEFNKVKVKVTASPKGSYHAMVWERPLKTRASAKDHYIVKRTYGSGLRFGVDYDRMTSVQKKRDDGELPTANQGLIGREWIVPNLYSRSQRTGKTLLRVSLAQSSAMHTEYFLDGRPTTKEEVASMCLASETAQRHNEMDVFDINTDSIISID